MENLKEKIFTKSSALRHLIMAGIMILVIAWSYISVALLANDWHWFTGNLEIPFNAQGISLVVGLVGGIPLVALAVAFGIYWSARLWMLPCLGKAVIRLLGAIPLVNLLLSGSLFSGFFGTLVDLVAPEDEGFWIYDPDWGWEYDDGSVCILIALPLTILVTILKSLFMSAINLAGAVLNLLSAIGLPVLCPILTLLAMEAVSMLMEISPLLLTLVGLLCLALVAFVCVIHPVVSYRRNR